MTQWKEVYDLLLNHIPESNREMRALRKFTYKAGGITNSIQLTDYEVALKMLDKAKDFGYIIADKEI